MTLFFATDAEGCLRLWRPPGDPQQIADDIASTIRHALTTSHATAALDEIKRQAREDAAAIILDHLGVPAQTLAEVLALIERES